MNFDVLRDLIYACEVQRLEAVRKYAVENIHFYGTVGISLSSLLPEELKPRFILMQPGAYEELFRRHELLRYYDQIKREMFGLKLIVTRDIANPVEIV